MNASSSLSTVFRRTFGIYVEQAPVLLTASITVDALIALDQVQLKRSPVLAIGVLLVNLVVFGLFVCLVVLVVADVWDGDPRRSTRELLRGAWSSLGPLLLVGVLAVIALTFLASIGSTIFFVVVIASVAFSYRDELLNLKRKRLRRSSV